MEQKKAKENEVHVRQDIDFGSWSAFAKALGHGFILDGFETKEMAIEGASRVLYALNKYGVEKYQSYDFEDKEFDRHPNYPVIED